MKALRVKVAIAGASVVALAALGVGALTFAAGADQEDSVRLTGYQEVPALSTPGVGEFRASVNRAGTELRYRLTYGGLESAATQAHIHFENETNSGGIVVFLCTNLGNGPAGTQACPANGGTITGTLHAADVTSGAASQGIDAGEFQEFLRAIRAGVTYVNVHSTGRPSGEIRAQLLGDRHDHRD